MFGSTTQESCQFGDWDSLKTKQIDLIKIGKPQMYYKHIEENMKSVVDHVVEFKKEQAKQMADG